MASGGCIEFAQQIALNVAKKTSGSHKQLQELSNCHRGRTIGNWIGGAIYKKSKTHRERVGVGAAGCQVHWQLLFNTGHIALNQHYARQRKRFPEFQAWLRRSNRTFLCFASLGSDTDTNAVADTATNLHIYICVCVYFQLLVARFVKQFVCSVTRTLCRSRELLIALVDCLITGCYRATPPHLPVQLQRCISANA